jgi:hypothetical protein
MKFLPFYSAVYKNHFFTVTRKKDGKKRVRMDRA